MMLAAAALRHAVAERIRRDHPDFRADGYVCQACNARYRAEYVQEMLEAERGELSSLDQDVVAAMRDQAFIASNLNEAFIERLTLGQRVADRVASFGGSWTFIILFAGIIFVWITINVGVLLAKPFDPYPYILLNLVLSTLARAAGPGDHDEPEPPGRQGSAPGGVRLSHQSQSRTRSASCCIPNWTSS